jgi:hypothetical protein
VLSVQSGISEGPSQRSQRKGEVGKKGGLLELSIIIIFIYSFIYFLRHVGMTKRSGPRVVQLLDRRSLPTMFFGPKSNQNEQLCLIPHPKQLSV